MRALWRGLVRTVLWSYDRGSWPYDLMVLAILTFVLLTPRRWFHDQPQIGVLAGTQIALVSPDDSGGARVYRMDAQLLPLSKRANKYTPELERETHDILGKSVDELKGHTFQITGIEPVRGDDGAVLYYDVKLAFSPRRGL